MRLENTPTNRWVTTWFAAIAVFIFAMVVLGGLVRLTGSGLSIVEWNLLMGTIPPLSNDAWQEVFTAYQQFPEFQQINHQMTLPEFKFIFLMEYAHRLLGRSLGLVFLIPFIVFVWFRKLTRKQILQASFLFMLGAAQGLMGWYMVKSGLVDMPRVSHIRLAAHLILALAAFSYSLWLCFDGWHNDQTKTHEWWRLGWVCLILLLLQIGLGAFVSGLHAGHMFNSFPKMGDQWLAEAATIMQPFWHNLVENPVMIQFMHRCGALVVSIAVSVYAYFLWRVYNKRLSMVLIGLLVCQVVLGILTLIWYVPTTLASAHQSVAFLLWGALLFSVHPKAVCSPVTK